MISCRWPLLGFVLISQIHAQSACTFNLKQFFLTPPDLAASCSSSVLEAQVQFFDEPSFTIAGVTDNTYRGGHGSDTALRSAESLAKATASLANVNDASGDPLKAVQAFQRAAELNPSESNLFDWGTELLIHRATEPAAEVFSKGVQLFPESVRMQLGLATAWYVAGAYRQAAECFFKAADMDPMDPIPYEFLSKARAHEVTESTGYQERMARFAKLQPDNALANYYYALSLWNRQIEPQTVRTLLEKAVKLDPHLSQAFLQLGIVDAAERKYPAAIAQYQKAIEANPDLEEAHYRLSEACRLTGDRVKAAQELALYNQLSKQSAETVERERRDLQQFVVDLRSR